MCEGSVGAVGERAVDAHCDHNASVERFRIR
jgi:hypothetical protein